mgnify:CR=1 FL=1
MHLLVLSAFRRENNREVITFVSLSQCTFWCSVLSDAYYASRLQEFDRTSQCTFWCSVLSDGEYWLRYGYAISVSMHLLVLSAFRRRVQFVSKQVRIVSMHLLVLSAFRPEEEATHILLFKDGLNAPFGAQCFPTE